jgi:4-hydroxybutyrate dehydrogenase / sulfolactaldehyde 3-reductase
MAEQNLSKTADERPIAGEASAAVTPPSPVRVLFVGLGTMGLPMARNLVRAGFAVAGHDADRHALERFGAAGGRAVADVRAEAAECDVLITMLPDDAIVTRVLGGANGLIAATRRGALVIEMSTTGPATKQALLREARSRGVDFIECPVGKTAEHAVAGTLALMAGGDTALIDRARPVLAPMGNEVHVCGEVGAASAMKLINNALVACINAASIEALVAGHKASLSVATMMSVLKTTMAWNNALASALPRKALKRDFTPGFMTRLAHKDVGLALAMARDLGAPMQQGEAAYALLGQALTDGYGADDTPGSMLRACEARAGTHLTP